MARELTLLPRHDHDTLATLGAGTWRADATMTRVRDISPALVARLGFPAARWEGEPALWHELLHPADRERVLKMRSERRDHTIEYRVLAADGETVWLRESVRFTAEGIESALLDVTRERRAIDALAWQRAVLESMAAGEPIERTLEIVCREAERRAPPGHIYSVLTLSRDGRHLEHGSAPSLPQEYNRAIHGIEIGPEVGSCGAAAYLRRPVAVSDIETDPRWSKFLHLARPLGLRACWSTPVFASDGTLLGTFAVYDRKPGQPTSEDREIVETATRLSAIAIERARAEEELRYQRDLTEAIVQNAGSALFMMDARGHPVFMNGAAAAMTGYSSIEEIRGRPLHDSVHFLKPDGSPYPMEECPIDRANAEMKPLRDQREVFCRKDGTLFPVEYNVAPVAREGEVLGAVIEVRDITERLQRERDFSERAERLSRITEMLARSNRELDQFAYITSHDLKAPLRGIANLSRWIEEDLGPHVTEDAREHLELLRGRVQRMESLIDAILEYSRVGRVRTRAEPVDARRLVEEIVDLVAPPPGFRIVVEGELPTFVTPRARLQQVLMNLIVNAIKHHHDRPRGRVVVGAEDAGSFWRFRVTDNGPGIDPRFHEKIFVIFQTLEPRDRVEGTGIGLALVKKIVESYGGRIEVASAVGEGSTFTFTWPKQLPEGSS